MRKLIPYLAALLIGGHLNGQQLIFPEGEDWKSPFEGDELSFQLAVDSVGAKFSAFSGASLGYSMDSLGNFHWKPSFDLVDRFEKKREASIIFQAEWSNGKKVSNSITFQIQHRNRPPVIEDLPVFYVKQSGRNDYQIPLDLVNDPDQDPLVARPIPSVMPEGATINALGRVTWTLSRNQFAAIKSTPTFIEFVVQDPDKAETRGKIRVLQTQQDLPPELLVLPGDSVFTIREDERVNVKLYISDPNGDDNVTEVSFVASDPSIPISSLASNSPVQYEFTWSPGYQFVDEATKETSVQITFFAIDKSNKRGQKRIRVKVKDAVDLVEKDKLMYAKYRSSLVQTKALIDLLDANYKTLNKSYKKAKKGKKQRAMLNASLGAATGLSPLMVPETSKAVSAVGGTTVLTLGTLEATEVIGKSKNDILDKMKVNVEIRNQLQVEGDNFARKYAFKSTRRNKEFDPDRQKLYPVINNQKLVLLELDASKSANPQYSNKQLKETFPDFGGE